MRIAKTNAILKRPVNKHFPIEYKYHETNQTDKAREQKLRWEAVVIGELKRKHDCVNITRGGGRVSLWTLQMLIF